MKLELPQPIFEKYSNIKFHENLSSGNQVVPSRKADRHMDTMKMLFTILRTCVKIIKTQ